MYSAIAATTWRTRRSCRLPKSDLVARQKRQLHEKKESQRLFDMFASLVTHFFMARDYTSVDAWGKPLNLIDLTLKVKYKMVPHENGRHAELLKWEEHLHATQTRKFDDDMRAWKDAGCAGHEPKKPALAAADPKAYRTARIIATLPYLLKALRAWQARNPTKPPAIGVGCSWGESLGSDNLWLESKIKQEKPENTELMEIAEAACEGAAKVDEVLRNIAACFKAKSVVPHPDPVKAAASITLAYRKKYVLVDCLRVVKAIVKCRILQLYEPKHMVYIRGSGDMEKHGDKWRSYWKEDKGVLDDKCFIMLAAFGAACQSVNLVEGSLLVSLEPYPLYRLGAVATIV